MKQLNYQTILSRFRRPVPVCGLVLAGLTTTALWTLYMKSDIEYGKSWLVLLAGLFGIMLLSWLFFNLINTRPAAEALEKSELFTSSRDGIVVVDGGGSLLQANAAFCRMLGYRQEELMALPHFSELTPAKWHEWEAGEIWDRRLLRDGYSGLYEKEYVRKDGSVFPVELQSFIFFNQDGTPQIHVERGARYQQPGQAGRGEEAA